MCALEIELLGAFDLRWEGTTVLGVGSPRTQSLLAYLLLHRGTPRPRQELAFLFWPDSSEPQARTNLRRELHLLRKSLPAAAAGYLRLGPGWLQWAPDGQVSFDVQAFEAAAAVLDDSEGPGEASIAAATEAVRLYKGDLLPACSDDWLVPERDRLKALAANALSRLAESLEVARRYSTALPYAQRLLALDPFDGKAQLRVMRLHAELGERTAALRAYGRFADLMAEELGVRPDAAVESLYRRLRDLGPRHGSARPPPPSEVHEARLVGRGPEWGALLAAWEQAMRFGVGLVTITGEAGAGKTRLAEALVAWASRQGVVTATARCYAAEGRLPYAPVRDWLRSEPFRQVLGRIDPLWAGELSRLLPELTGSRPDVVAPAALTDGWQRQRLYEAITGAVLAAPHPTLLFLDDLQWCDSDTLEWFHHLLRSGGGERLLLLTTARGSAMGDDPAVRSLLLACAERGWSTTIELGSLDRSETAELAALVAGSPLTDANLEALFTRTEGNPLFIVEAVRAGFAPALVPGGPERFHDLPPRIQAVIAWRLGQLSDPARQVVHLAATLGRVFSFAVLERASELPADALTDALEELWQRNVIRVRSDDQGSGPEGPALVYDFSHDLLCQGAYAELSPARRRALHERVAAAIEAVYAGALDGVSARLAGHFE